MKKYTSVFAAIMIMFFAVTAHAQQNITADQLNAFLSTLKDVKSLSQDLNEKGKVGFLRKNLGVVNNEGFTPYTSAVGLLKVNFPKHYSRMQSTAKRAGFSSLAQWSQTGDTIIAAYMSNKVLPGDKSQLTPIEQADPKSIATMSQRAQDRIKTTQYTMKLLRNVSDENRRLASKYKTQIEQAIK